MFGIFILEKKDYAAMLFLLRSPLLIGCGKCLF